MTAHDSHDDHDGDTRPGSGAPRPPTDSPVDDPHQGEHPSQREAAGSSNGHDEATDAQRLLAVYLRDHHAASVAGVALVRRTHSNNVGSEFEHELRDLSAEIEQDAERLDAAMASLGVEPSRTKDVAARAGEVIARLKGNGRLVQYSPTSRVLELEALTAGINAKSGLWRALGAADQDALGSSELQKLSSRADRQLAVADDLHGRAVQLAFQT